jgi:NAD(P)-dependent dehydrogenase (short-subunit alcohol dehydrogenase family)
MEKSTWLITGASSGLGYALAEHVLELLPQGLGQAFKRELARRVPTVDRESCDP